MASVTRNDYNYLRSYMLNTSNNYVDKHKIDKLKLQYELEINSTRRLQQIGTIQDLIELLEKRAYLSENDITAFTDIAKSINNKEFLREVEKRHNITQEHPDVDIKVEDEVLKKVYDLIINEMGKSWTDFARGLNMRESKLDELKIKYNDNLQGCVKEVLLYHQRNAHRRDWKMMLLNALTEARRNDLRNAVENIYYKYS